MRRTHQLSRLWRVRACTICATHSQPAFVQRPCWKGAVATSALLANCFANQIVEQCRPQRSPIGLANAVNHPKRMPSITSATANLDATCTNNSESASFEDREQVICCHSRKTWGCTPPGCPQTREQASPSNSKSPLVQIAKSLGSIRVWALVGVGQGLSIPSKLSTFLAPHWRLPSRTVDNSPKRTKLCARSTRLWIPSSCLWRRRRLTND